MGEDEKVPNHILLRAARAPVAALVAAGLLVSACQDKRGGPIPYEPASFGNPDALSTVALDADYKIAPLDKLSVRVFRMADLTGEYDVDLAGNISMPLIGEIRAVDMTTAQLDTELTRKLGEKYLENPDVSVGIKSSTSRVVTVDGAVQRAGAYPAVGNVSLMQAVALAGGTTEDANTRRVAVFRQIGGRRQAAAFDLASIRRGEMDDPRVFAGDIVIVDGSSVKTRTKQILNSLPLLNIFRPF